jgi:tagatose 6-phosphate kinase
MIKPSLEELETELGRRADAAELLERGEAWLAAGVQHVCISLGSGGVLWLSTAGTNLVTIHAPTVPYNSIGCGDTLVGATGAAYLAAHDTEAALRYGVAAATANLRYDQPGHCTTDDVRNLLPATHIDPITEAGIKELLPALTIRSRQPAASPQEAGAELP